jgi:hypothetical protein
VRNLGRQGVQLMLVAGLLGCATGRNYPDPHGPRYAGGTAVATGTGSKNATALRVVSFNIEYALRVDSAIAVLAGDPAPRSADVRSPRFSLLEVLWLINPSSVRARLTAAALTSRR